MRKLLEIPSEKKAFAGGEVEHGFEELGKRMVLLNERQGDDS